MKKTIAAMIATVMITAPVQAAEWNEVKAGTFIGARLTIGGKTGGRPSAALTIAPTQSRIAYDGFSSMKIGEGIALNLTPGAKPTLTLAGVRADRALHLNADADGGDKAGPSTGVWIAIGVAAAVGAGALWYSDYCNDNESTLCGDSE